jgi:hypothetical protein
MSKKYVLLQRRDYCRYARKLERALDEFRQEWFFKVTHEPGDTTVGDQELWDIHEFPELHLSPSRRKALSKAAEKLIWHLYSLYTLAHGVPGVELSLSMKDLRCEERWAEMERRWAEKEREKKLKREERARFMRDEITPDKFGHA